jgi:hypothetical protein
MLRQRQHTTQEMIRDGEDMEATVAAIPENVFIIRAGRTDYQIEVSDNGALIITAVANTIDQRLQISPTSGNRIELRMW